MTFIEYGLVRGILERAFDVLKFGEVVPGNIAQHDLRAKPAAAAILDEAGPPFHHVPIPDANSKPCLRRRLATSGDGPFTPTADEPFVLGHPPPIDQFEW